MKKMSIPALLALVAALFGGNAIAAIVDIKFDTQGRFAHEVEMPVGKTIEVCGPLKAGVVVDWSFKNAAPLNFNIHFHKGEAVSYPFQQKGASNLAQKFTPETDQDYCWMWTNRNITPVKLNVELSIAVPKADAAVLKVDAAKVDADMTAGEIRKVDKDTKKITIKHSEIKNLEMPAMTMVFHVKEASLLDKVQAGDKVKFMVEKIGSAYVIADILVEKAEK
jgi:Cu(I)/Ag(I) efflux system periplasmic protein CusF